jgi:hypothetical protein
VASRRDRRPHHFSLDNRLRFGILAFEDQLSRLGDVRVRAGAVLGDRRTGPERVLIKLDSLGGGSAEEEG